MRTKSHLNKTSATGVTAVRFLSGVNARVSLQVGWPVKLCTAHAAAVRLVTCQHIIQSLLTNKIIGNYEKGSSNFNSPEETVLLPRLPE